MSTVHGDRAVSGEPKTRPVLTTAAQQAAPVSPQGIRIWSHSPLLYWWPVWVVGYVMALVTYFAGEQYQIGDVWEYIHPSTNLGVIFIGMLFLVILVTSIPARGLTSAVLVGGTAVLFAVLALFGWFDAVLAWVADLKVHLNMGAYFWLSTLLFIAWALSVFIFDRASWWLVSPTQIVHRTGFGAGSKVYDIAGMTFEKRRDDFFRNWILGFGSGDLHIAFSGAPNERIEIPNVLFLGSKLKYLEAIVAMRPSVVPKQQISKSGGP